MSDWVLSATNLKAGCWHRERVGCTVHCSDTHLKAPVGNEGLNIELGGTFLTCIGKSVLLFIVLDHA